MPGSGTMPPSRTAWPPANWDRVTQSMVEEGIAREKAGKPAKPEIDADLAGLTKETGKEWLDFYRQRAAR